MIIESKAGPTLANPNTTDSTTQLAAKARAIATLEQLASKNVVNNANQVSPEEMPAVAPPSRRADNVETSSELPPAETKAAEEPISSQYAVLARKEKALRLRDQQLRQREAAIKAAEQPKPSATPTFDESKYVSKDRLSQDPFGALNELGLDYEKLTNLVLNGPTPDQRAQTEYVKKLEQRLQVLEGKTDQTLKTFEEREVQSRQGAVSQIRYEVSKLVNADPTFEVIKSTNSVKDVVELIESVFDKGMGPEYPKGTLLTAEEAAQMVEDHLIDEALKFTKIKKIQQRLKPREEVQAQATSRSPQQQQLKTLTNSTSSSRKLSAKERAIAVFKGELK